MTDQLITDYGAVCDGETLDTEAIHKAIDACHAAGGGRVVVPAGRKCLTGTIELKTGVDLHVERGATLLASDNIDHYTAAAFPGSDKPGWALIVAHDAEDVAITGDGVIDGQGRAFMESLDRYHYNARRDRPQLIGFFNCRRVTMRDVTIRDSANWAVHPAGCEDVLITGIRILNDLRLPNCDGIDPDHCRRVRISDCHIDAGDDCIVIKNRQEFPDAGPSEDIVVTNCVMCSTSTAVKIGTESMDDFRRITFSNCIIRSSNRGLSIQLRDAGNVEDILFSDCIIETRYFYPSWWGRSEPIYVTAVHRAPGTKLGRVRNVRFRNILCRSENGVFLVGSEDSPLQDVELSDVRVEIDKWSKWPGGQQDRRPCMSPNTDFGIEPEKDAGLTEHPTSGVYAENATGLRLRGVRVVWGANKQDYWAHGIEAHNVEGLDLEGFEAPAGKDDLPDRKIE
ncbi:MAG: glycoside hydrolase family 28 protein [Phycisphaerae bacterium]